MKTVLSEIGDTWDTIARRVYGDEKLAQYLMQARGNIRLLDWQVFPGGLTVTIPDKPEKTEADDLPVWRK